MENEAVVGSAIYRKIVAVYQDVDYIQKDKRNDFHKYTYASEAAIKSALHEAFAKHGLAMLPPDIESIHDGEKDAKGQFLTTVKVRFGIADQESGETVSGVIFGRGVDNSDKGIYKAITGGLKYWLTTTFLIPTGDDPEEDEAPKGKQAASAQPAKTQTPTKPVPPPPANNTRPAMPDTSKAHQGPTLREQIAAMRDTLGPKTWMRIMGNEGCTEMGDINGPDHAKRILDVMKAEALKVTEKDLAGAKA